MSAPQLKVVLIDRNDHYRLQPLLYQLATGALALMDIALAIRSIFARKLSFEVLPGEVYPIDVAVCPVPVDDVGAMKYHQPVLASGAGSSWFRQAGWTQHSNALRAFADAGSLRLALLGAFERAEGWPDPDEVSRPLTFVVAGGSPSGGELAASIFTLARDAEPADFRRTSPDHFRVILFESGSVLLADFPIGWRPNPACSSIGWVSRCITAPKSKRLMPKAWSRRPSAHSATICFGVRAWSRCQSPRGPAPLWPSTAQCRWPQIIRCPVIPILTINDVASFKGPIGGPLPGVAALARQQQRYFTAVIAARTQAMAAPKRFRYRDQGSLAIISAGLLSPALPHPKVLGLPAWLLWASLDLVTLGELENRIIVYVSRGSAWPLNRRGARVTPLDSTLLDDIRLQPSTENAARLRNNKMRQGETLTSEPSMVAGQTLYIDDYAMNGDCLTGALVVRNGLPRPQQAEQQSRRAWLGVSRRRLHLDSVDEAYFRTHPYRRCPAVCSARHQPDCGSVFRQERQRGPPRSFTQVSNWPARHISQLWSVSRHGADLVAGDSAPLTRKWRRDDERRFAVPG